MLRSGRVKKGDGKEIDHRDHNPHNDNPKNLRVISRSKNRAWPRDKNNKPTGQLGAYIEGLTEFARIRLKGGFMAETPATVGVRIGGPKRTYIISDKNTAAEISVLGGGKREIHIDNRTIPKGETGNNGGPLLRLLRRHTEHTKKRGRPITWTATVKNPKLKKTAERLYPKQTEFSEKPAILKRLVFQLKRKGHSTGELSEFSGGLVELMDLTRTRVAKRFFAGKTPKVKRDQIRRILNKINPSQSGDIGPIKAVQIGGKPHIIVHRGHEHKHHAKTGPSPRRWGVHASTSKRVARTYSANHATMSLSNTKKKGIPQSRISSYAIPAASFLKEAKKAERLRRSSAKGKFNPDGDSSAGVPKGAKASLDLDGINFGHSAIVMKGDIAKKTRLKTGRAFPKKSLRKRIKKKHWDDVIAEIDKTNPKGAGGDFEGYTPIMKKGARRAVLWGENYGKSEFLKPSSRMRRTKPVRKKKKD
tara:strand:+ start:4722 stop:6146 length:1425 start_codon:yes stop_codon:yes gene_type:complete